MEKKSIEEIKELIDKFEGTCGESFVDYFIDDNINNIGFLVGYIYGKFPDLGKGVVGQFKLENCMEIRSRLLL